ncbi:unnamed protein product [Lupinus luteus]|uniref:Uncharacterized protein n=1 Tax=Lupinus luteus TaxID=3873 RepID=A0AAV1Y0Y3_LUPLU
MAGQGDRVLLGQWIHVREGGNCKTEPSTKQQTSQPTNPNTMADMMDIHGNNRSYSSKGKTVLIASNPPSAAKAIPWVEKYRPQSLNDVVAHRDIVDTSNSLSLPSFFSSVYHSSSSV